MGDTEGFDEEAAAGTEALYTTAAAEERRRFVRRHLDPRAGEAILSIGCGPGFEPAELAERALPDGHVHAIDASEPMVALARERCRDRDAVTVGYGDATALPIDDASVDAATAVQVYEYVEDVDAALAELARVLRPGGRAAVYVTDWGTTIWNSADEERTGRVVDAWRDHRPHPDLPATLRGPVRSAGLRVDRIEPFTIVETELQDTFAGLMRAILRSHAADHEDVGREAAYAWGEDLRDRDDAGETFFSLTAHLSVLEKPV